MVVTERGETCLMLDCDRGYMILGLMHTLVTVHGTVVRSRWACTIITFRNARRHRR